MQQTGMNYEFKLTNILVHIRFQKFDDKTFIFLNKMRQTNKIHLCHKESLLGI